jgi:cyclic pyranopterin monophosphate synthase
MLLANGMVKLTHLNEAGEAHMVDVGDKPVTRRLAIAEGRIYMQPQTLQMIISGSHKKGDVVAVARVAGIMAAKKTAELIPLCHPLALPQVELDLQPLPEQGCVYCRATVATQERTGVEMEALMAVEIALLTVYDMCKAVDRGMTIGEVRLLEKSGGRSGTWKRSRNEHAE